MRAHARIAMGALAAAIAVGGVACGGSEGGGGGDEAPTTDGHTTSAPPPPATTAHQHNPREPDPGLPPCTAGYQDGLKLNSEPIPPSASAPHGEVKEVYVNQTRATIAPEGAQAFPYPDGTVVAKTGSRGGDNAAIVAIMRKEAGLDPEHGDWQFVEYSRSSPDAEYALLASDSVCWTCHVNAESTDWVYTRLE